jgi:hypothetical protein
MCVVTGEVLVIDTKNHRVVSWRLADGGGCRVVCGTCAAGSGVEQFNQPCGIVTTDGGAVWVADNMNQRLCLFR